MWRAKNILMREPLDSISSLLAEPITVKVVDIGANPIDHAPPYRKMLQRGMAHVIGFEPHPEAMAKLQASKGPNEQYFPYVLGDGAVHTMHYCYASGMNSLLVPNRELFQYFHGLAEWGRILRTEQVQTRRLDDVAEVDDIDLLKIDVQGAEMQIFQNAPRKLSNTLVIHTEVVFLPVYEQQPLASELDEYLRRQGFLFHRYMHLASRVVAPMTVGDNVHAGLSQTFEGDAVYVRDFRRFQELQPEKLLKLAVILHDIYRSYDLAYRALMQRDKVLGTDLSEAYIDALIGDSEQGAN